MKIYYKHKEGYCETPCPYGFTNGYTGDHKLVGSYACADCMYFVTDSFDKNWVECNYEEKKPKKRIKKFGHKKIIRIFASKKRIEWKKQ